MRTLTFKAAQVGTDISFGVITTGAATSFDEDPIHYVSLQIPEGASVLGDVYIEVDDQVNGRFSNIASSTLFPDQWVVDLVQPLHTDQSVNRVVVLLTASLTDDLRKGLSTVAAVAASLVGTET